MEEARSLRDTTVFFAKGPPGAYDDALPRRPDDMPSPAGLWQPLQTGTSCIESVTTGRLIDLLADSHGVFRAQSMETCDK